MRVSAQRTGFGFGLAAAVLAMAGPALAHHLSGGEAPATLWHGTLSGFDRAMAGVEHAAAVIAIGLAPAFLLARHVMPLFRPAT